MNVLYIGILSNGTTSKMRADKLKQILSQSHFDIIDTDIPKKDCAKIWQSIGFRYKIGPLVTKVNKYIIENLNNKIYDLIWVDKAIYLTRKTTEILRKHSIKLVHYTPDPAFTFHRSNLFYSSLPLYDYAITTKSFEIDSYARLMGSKDKVIYTTQGYDKALHQPMVDWANKKGVAFIGHYERERERAIKYMLKNDICITLAGIGWEKFAQKHHCSNLNYLGNGVYGDKYVYTISSCRYGWGSVSKWIPEKHTTRTFEIPACKTALLTERNSEIQEFFNDDEVIYYNNLQELIDRIKYFDLHESELKMVIEKGYLKVTTGGFDYESIIHNLLIKMKIL